MTKRAKWIIVSRAVVLLVGLVLGSLMLLRMVSRSAPDAAPRVGQPAEEAKREVPGEAAQQEGEAATASSVDESDIRRVIDGATSEIKPTDWQMPAVEGGPGRFSAEDYAKARELIDRYLGNFSRIHSLKLHHETVTTGEVENDFTEEYLRTRPMDNSSFDLEITRQPVFFKMTGIQGDGEHVREVVTPVGKISSGHLGRGESWVPYYLDRSPGLANRTLLNLGKYVHENVPMNLDLPALGDVLQETNIKKHTYDVIEAINLGPPRDVVWLSTTYWFNRDTGMLDLVIRRRVQPAKEEPAIYGATLVDYYDLGGIYYPKRIVGYSFDGQIRREERMTKVVANGVAEQ